MSWNLEIGLKPNDIESSFSTIPLVSRTMSYLSSNLGLSLSCWHWRPPHVGSQEAFKRLTYPDVHLFESQEESVSFGFSKPQFDTTIACLPLPTHRSERKLMLLPTSITSWSHPDHGKSFDLLNLSFWHKPSLVWSSEAQLFIISGIRECGMLFN